MGNLKIVDDRLQGLNVTYFDHDSMDRVGKKATITGWIYYEFDLSGKRTKLVDPDGETNYYVYDAAGRLDKLQVAAGRSAYFAYDLSGMVTRRHAPLDEVVAYYTYDAAGRLKQLENRNVVGGLLSYFAYERNQIGAQTRIRHEGDEDTYYEYDALDRLTREFRLPTGTGREHDDAYVYDAVGNRTVKADQTAGENVYYTFDARNLMSKEWNKDAPETTYFDYDNARRMTSLKIEGGQSSYFAHDQREQVKRIEFAKASSPDQTQEFGYNGAGERVKLKIGDGSLTDLRLAFDGRKLLAEKNLAAIGFPTIRRYRHNTSLLDCMGSAIEWEFNGSRLYGAFNGLGTLTNLLRDFGGGEIVDNTYVRDVFGKLVTASTPLGSDAGKLHFLTSGLLDLQLTNVQMNPLLLGGGCFLPKWDVPLSGGPGKGASPRGLSEREKTAAFLHWLLRNGMVMLCQDQGGDTAPVTSPNPTGAGTTLTRPWSSTPVDEHTEFAFAPSGVPEGCLTVCFRQTIQILAKANANDVYAPIKPREYHPLFAFKEITMVGDDPATLVDESNTVIDFGDRDDNEPCGYHWTKGTGGAPFFTDLVQIGGGLRKFKSPNNIDGWEAIKYLFELCALCEDQNYSVLGCVTWEFEKTAADDAAGRPGRSWPTGQSPSASKTWQDAFKKFRRHIGK
ncbi:MAG: RHS repeat protein [Fimbriimonadaceae bacterium]|nr:RHS repeat protein [Fimbriimonadaceae bacterium]